MPGYPTCPTDQARSATDREGGPPPTQPECPPLPTTTTTTEPEGDPEPTTTTTSSPEPTTTTGQDVCIVNGEPVTGALCDPPVQPATTIVTPTTAAPCTVNGVIVPGATCDPETTTTTGATTTAAAVPAAAPGELAFTGSGAETLAVVGFAMLGAGLLARSRARRQRAQQ